MISLKINALYGLMGVGIYLAINAFLTLLALLASKKKRKRRFNANLVIN